MKKFLLISFLMLIPASLQADKIVKPKEPPKTENSEEKSDEKSEKSSGGALGSFEVISILTLAGASIYFTRKKKI